MNLQPAPCAHTPIRWLKRQRCRRRGSLGQGRRRTRARARVALQLNFSRSFAPLPVTNTNLQGRFPIHWAAISGHTDVVSTLLDNKSPSNCMDSRGETVRGWACACANQRIPKSNGVRSKLISLNMHMQPIHYASFFGHLETAFVLISNKTAPAEVNVQDFEGISPIHCAWGGIRISGICISAPTHDRDLNSPFSLFMTMTSRGCTSRSCGHYPPAVGERGVPQLHGGERQQVHPPRLRSARFVLDLLVMKGRPFHMHVHVHENMQLIN